MQQVPEQANFESNIDGAYEFHFQIEGGGEQCIAMTLESVESGSSQSEEFESYVLVFRGPGEVPLPQGTYGVRWEEEDLFPLFIVPFAGNEQGYSYEAIISRKKNPDG